MDRRVAHIHVVESSILSTGTNLGKFALGKLAVFSLLTYIHGSAIL